MLASAFEKARRSGERISEMRLHVVDARLEHARTGRPATAALDTTELMAREAGAVGVELEAALERAAQLAGSRPAEARRGLAATLARIPDAARSGLGRRALKLLETMGED
jgi:hypothetical protein